MPTERQQRIVRAVLDALDDYLPSNLQFRDDECPAVAFGIAATRHAGNLLAGEMDLALAGRWSVTRVLGRSLIESWLWANAFFLDGDDALDRLMAEDGDHQRRSEAGRRKIWDELESRREGGIDLRRQTPPPEIRAGSDVAGLAAWVRTLRESHDVQGGIALLTYEMDYRHASSADVHVSFDLLCRYFEDFTTTGMTILRDPHVEAVSPVDGPLALHRDAGRVADAWHIPTCI